MVAGRMSCMYWLMSDDALQVRMMREFRGPVLARGRVSADSAPPALPLTVANGVATIRVEGVLTPTPDPASQFYGEANTTYADLSAALSAALEDKSVREIVWVINSPGGMVDGFFALLEDIASARASGGKPMRALAQNATSAAYGIAAAVGKIEATSRTGVFGSVGVATSAFVLGDMIGKVVDITNTDAPDKRPSVGTPEGKAVVVKLLDQIGTEFMGVIAQGRGLQVADVASRYGRGASMLAPAALAAGMIDGMAPKRKGALDRAGRSGYGASGMAQTDTQPADAKPEAPAGDPPAGDPPAEEAPVQEPTPAEPPAGDPPTNASAAAAAQVLTAAERAELAELRAERTSRVDAERLGLVGELVALRAETPATAYAAPGRLCARLASESLADMRARVTALKALAPVAAAAHTPPPVGRTPEGDNLTDAQRAEAAKLSDPAHRARFVKICNDLNGNR
jgi:ClpP class serine protease